MPDISTHGPGGDNKPLDLPAMPIPPEPPPDEDATLQAMVCSVDKRRAGMSDTEFWQDVADTIIGPPPPPEELPGMEMGYNGHLAYPELCPECGSDGACGYDTEGRPMIHAIKEDADER